MRSKSVPAPRDHAELWHRLLRVHKNLPGRVAPGGGGTSELSAEDRRLDGREEAAQKADQSRAPEPRGLAPDHRPGPKGTRRSLKDQFDHLPLLRLVSAWVTELEREGGHESVRAAAENQLDPRYDLRHITSKVGENY